MGTHIGNVSETVTKTRLNKNGQALPADGGDASVDKIKKQFDDAEGCRVAGYFYVYKVPGNIHFSTVNYNTQIKQAIGNLSNMDMSHRVNHFTFGTEEDMANIEKKFKEGNLRPLD